MHLGYSPPFTQDADRIFTTSQTIRDFLLQKRGASRNFLARTSNGTRGSHVLIRFSSLHDQRFIILTR